jgi:hypothetical protein
MTVPVIAEHLARTTESICGLVYTSPPRGLRSIFGDTIVCLPAFGHPRLDWLNNREQMTLEVPACASRPSCCISCPVPLLVRTTHVLLFITPTLGHVTLPFRTTVV